jgi:hypothetical protein
MGAKGIVGVAWIVRVWVADQISQCGQQTLAVDRDHVVHGKLLHGDRPRIREVRMQRRSNAALRLC